MAYYLVTAKPRRNCLHHLERKLRSRAFVAMEPFGRSMTVSLENARMRRDGCAVWEEEDYCSPPLREERAAALDEHFDDIRVTPVARNQGWKQIEHLPRLFPGLED